MQAKRSAALAISTLLATLTAMGISAGETVSGQETAKDGIAATASSSLAASIETFVAERAAADELSGVVLVTREPDTILRRAVGLADRALGVPNRPETRFNLGSVGKIFTGVAICLLAQDGKLSVDDPVGKYLPDYPQKEVAQRITLAQLLTHTSGLGDFFNHRFGARKLELRTLSDYLDLFAQDPLQSEPGAEFRYSNAGAIVLGRVIERVSGQTYYDFVEDRIFKPLGMAGSGFFELDRVVPDLATGYTRWRVTYDEQGMDGEEIDGPWRTNALTRAYKGSSAGGGYSTVDDLARFARGLLDHHLLDAAHTEMLLTPRVERRPGRQYGYLINVKDVQGHRAYGHNGGAPGVSASFWMYPDLGYTVVVLGNQDEAARPVARFIEERILDTAASQ